MIRCSWAKNDLAIAYHDAEWGVALHDDRGLFEFLILEGAQAGLSWDTILRKRENYRAAFDNFDAGRIAQYDVRKIAELLQDEGIIRNRLKIASAVQNAKAFLNVREEFGSFDMYIWSFVDGKPIVNRIENTTDVPARNEISDLISKDLRETRVQFRRLDDNVRVHAGHRDG